MNKEWKFMNNPWILFGIAFVAGLLMFLASVIGAGAADNTFRDMLRSYRSEVGTKRTTKKRSTTTVCSISHYKYVWHKNKLVKVPVTVCEEK